YEKSLRAQREGAFDAEIVPVEVPGRKGAVTVVNRDETPRETSLESLAKLQPAFKPGGTITAGNASKLNDGGAAVIVASEERARGGAASHRSASGAAKRSRSRSSCGDGGAGAHQRVRVHRQAR